MAARVCLDCPDIGAWKRGRCPRCQAVKDRQRGTTTERGYGSTHARESRMWIAKVRAGDLVLCWRCSEPITDPTDCHLGHDDHDRSMTRGPEHGRACNLSEAGKARQRLYPHGA